MIEKLIEGFRGILESYHAFLDGSFGSPLSSVLYYISLVIAFILIAGIVAAIVYGVGVLAVWAVGGLFIAGTYLSAAVINHRRNVRYGRRLRERDTLLTGQGRTRFGK